MHFHNKKKKVLKFSILDFKSLHALVVFGQLFSQFPQLEALLTDFVKTFQAKGKRVSAKKTRSKWVSLKKVTRKEKNLETHISFQQQLENVCTYARTRLAEKSLHLPTTDNELNGSPSAPHTNKLSQLFLMMWVFIMCCKIYFAYEFNLILHICLFLSW